MIITFEGGECGGKDTQIKLLADRLRSEGHNVSDIKISEPGSTPIGDMSRILAKNTIDKEHLEPFRNVHEHINKQNITPLTQMSLFFASRAEVYDKLVRPQKEQGKIVLLNRSLDSTTVYQGHAQDPKLIPLIRATNQAIVDELNIDLTILLDLPVPVALQRMQERDGEEGDRYQDMNQSFHERVRQGYLEEAKVFSRIAVVDASNSIDKVHEDIYQKVKEKITSYN